MPRPLTSMSLIWRPAARARAWWACTVSSAVRGVVVAGAWNVRSSATMRRVSGEVAALCVAAAAGCAPAVEVAAPAEVAAAGVETPRVAAPGVAAGREVRPTAPELRQLWAVRAMERELAAVDGGSGVVGRWSESPETIARVDARTGAEQWRVAQPGGVVWLAVRVGRTHAAISGRAPGAGERHGWIDLRDGKLAWEQRLAAGDMVVVGRDGTGTGLSRGCELVALDASTGRPVATVRGRTAGLGHAGPEGAQIEVLCVTPPVLLGQTGACAVTLAPTETADATISAVGPAGPCWTVKLGRVDDIVQVDGAWIWWHDGATLHVGALDRTNGSWSVRRTFPGGPCHPSARVIDDRTIAAHGCGEVTAIAADGAVRWTTRVEADAVAITGVEGAVLADSPGARSVQWLTPGGALAGRVTVPDRASARAIAAGLLVDTGEALALWDPQGTLRWQVPAQRERWSALQGLVFVYKNMDEGTVVIAASSGEVLGRDPFGARPLAVLPGAVVMHAGYLWARALP